MIEQTNQKTAIGCIFKEIDWSIPAKKNIDPKRKDISTSGVMRSFLIRTHPAVLINIRIEATISTKLFISYRFSFEKRNNAYYSVAA